MSPRQVDLARAREVLSVVPPDVVRVGVFVDAPDSEIESAVSECGLDEVQLHGDEPPKRCAATGVRTVKAFRVSDGFDRADLEPYRDVVDAVLLDGFDPHERGGTGQTFEWGAVGPAPDWAELIVAGGLTPANVGRAIGLLRPFGVDVSSGVEEWPGNKDKNRMRAFIAAVREADAGAVEAS